MNSLPQTRQPASGRDRTLRRLALGALFGAVVGVIGVVDLLFVVVPYLDGEELLGDERLERALGRLVFVSLMMAFQGPLHSGRPPTNAPASSLTMFVDQPTTSAHWPAANLRRNCLASIPSFLIPSDRPIIFFTFSAAALISVAAGLSDAQQSM